MMQPVRLTKKTAQFLVKRIFPGVKLEQKDKFGDGSIIFTGQTALDGLTVRCENDWGLYINRIRLTLSDGSGSSIVQFYHPETLERDYSLEDVYKREQEVEHRKEWVQSIGPDRAHKLVDQYWEG